MEAWLCTSDAGTCATFFARDLHRAPVRKRAFRPRAPGHLNEDGGLGDAPGSWFLLPAAQSRSRGHPVGYAAFMDPRLPLQTGARMLLRIFWATLVLAAIWAVLPTGGLGAILWVYFSPLTAMVLVATLGRTRASDCVLDRDELKIEGGKYDGFHINWEAIDAEGTRLNEDGGLVLDLGSGVTVPIAVASGGDELRSLRALLDVIRERRGHTHNGEAAPPEAKPEAPQSAPKLEAPHRRRNHLASIARDRAWLADGRRELLFGAADRTVVSYSGYRSASRALADAGLRGALRAAAGRPRPVQVLWGTAAGSLG